MKVIKILIFLSLVLLFGTNELLAQNTTQDHNTKKTPEPEITVKDNEGLAFDKKHNKGAKMKMSPKEAKRQRDQRIQAIARRHKSKERIPAENSEKNKKKVKDNHNK